MTWNFEIINKVISTIIVLPCFLLKVSLVFIYIPLLFSFCISGMHYLEIFSERTLQVSQDHWTNAKEGTITRTQPEFLKNKKLSNIWTNYLSFQGYIIVTIFLCHPTSFSWSSPGIFLSYHVLPLQCAGT